MAQRVKQQVKASLDPGGPILQLLDKTYPEGHCLVALQDSCARA